MTISLLLCRLTSALGQLVSGCEMARGLVVTVVGVTVGVFFVVLCDVGLVFCFCGFVGRVGVPSADFFGAGGSLDRLSDYGLAAVRIDVGWLFDGSLAVGVVGFGCVPVACFVLFPGGFLGLGVVVGFEFGFFAAGDVVFLVEVGRDPALPDEVVFAASAFVDFSADVVFVICVAAFFGE